MVTDQNAGARRWPMRIAYMTRNALLASILWAATMKADAVMGGQWRNTSYPPGGMITSEGATYLLECLAFAGLVAGLLVPKYHRQTLVLFVGASLCMIVGSEAIDFWFRPYIVSKVCALLFATLCAIVIIWIAQAVSDSSIKIIGPSCPES